MPVLVAAGNSIPPLSYPWWVTNALVPAAISVIGSVIGSLLTFGLALLVARRSEFYRRLSRWEPYGHELWSLQQRLYGEVCEAARKATAAADAWAYSHEGANVEERKRLFDTYTTAMAELNQLWIQVMLLLSPRFNEAFTKFRRDVDLHQPVSNSFPESRLQANKRTDEMYSHYRELVESARESLGIDALGEQAITAILSGLKGK